MRRVDYARSRVAPSAQACGPVTRGRRSVASRSTDRHLRDPKVRLYAIVRPGSDGDPLALVGVHRLHAPPSAAYPRRVLRVDLQRVDHDG